MVACAAMLAERDGAHLCICASAGIMTSPVPNSTDAMWSARECRGCRPQAQEQDGSRLLVLAARCSLLTAHCLEAHANFGAAPTASPLHV